MGPFVAQVIAALIANLPMFSAGLIFGWASPSLPKLLQQSDDPNDESELRITVDEGSWVVSFASIGAIFGPILLNLLVDRIGRKWSLNVIVLPILLSWLMIGLATSVEILYAGRFIGGLSVGACYALMPMYLGEIADDRIRGALGTLMSTILNVGLLMSYCVGPWVPREMLAGISAIPPILFLILSPWIPETPHYFLMKGAREKALASLIWLRRRTDVREELSNLEAIVIEEQKRRTGFEIGALFYSTGNRKAFLISLGLLTLQQCSGIIVILSYASLIFESSGLTGWSSYSVIIMGCFKLVAGIGVTFLIDVAGRRPILMLSAIASAFFLICEAVFFNLKYLGYETSSYSWLPLVGIIGFVLSFIPGFGSIPYAMIGELFPTNVKASATMLLSVYGSLMGVAITKIYQLVSDEIGIHWIFYAFGFITLNGVLFVYFCVPETKRISLEDIQEFLNSGRSANSMPAIDDRDERTNHTKRY